MAGDTGPVPSSSGTFGVFNLFFQKTRRLEHREDSVTDSHHPLPDPQTDGEISVEVAIAERRSARAFEDSDLTEEEIGQLLWAMQGVTGDLVSRRAAPSAGGCHPLIVYVCRNNGVWRYQPQDHSLTRHREGDHREALARAALGQSFVAQAPAVFVVSAVFERTTSRYGNRGRVRYVPMDAGHAAENLLLQAVALDLAGVPVGAFDDGGVRRVLALPAEEEPLYLLPIGRRRDR